MTASRIKMIYMSGAGNTAWVARRLAEHLTAQGNDVTCESCEAVTPAEFDIESADMLGVLLPVWASFAPAQLREFFDALPPAEGKPLFGVACAAYFAGDSAWYACRPLARKGYRPFLYANVFMPNVLYPVPRPEQVPKILAKAERKVEQIAGRVHARERRFEGVHPLGWLGGYMQRWGYPPMERASQKYIFVDESCTRCGWCATHCPVGNIEMTEDGPRFLGKCELCTRCFHYCPAHAIQFTNATKNEERFRRYDGVEGRRYGGPTKCDPQKCASE